MQLTVTDVDYAPDELYEQVPFTVSLLREMPGSDRPDYWLGVLHSPLRWVTHEGETREVTHLLIAARYVGERIRPGAHELTIGISYVTDQTLLEDARFDWTKIAYVAIG